MPQSKPEGNVSFASLIAEGERLEDLHLLKEARDHYLQATHLAALRGDLPNQAWGLVRQCRAAWAADQTEEAAGLCQEALTLAQATSSRKAEAEAEKTLGALAAGRGDYAAGERLLLRAASLATAAGETEIGITALNNLGATYLEQGRIEEAVDYGKKALAAVQAFRETSVRMRFAVPFNLAKALEARGDEESARQWLDRAARSAEETQFHGGLHHVLMESARLLLRAGDLDGAGDYYDRAIAWNEAVPDLDVDVALARQGRASTLEARGRVLEALPSYEAAVAVFEKRRLFSLTPEPLIAIGRCLTTLGRFDEADETLSRAESRARRMGLRISEEVARLERARVLEGRRLPEAEFAFEKSARGLTTLGLPSYAARAHLGVARARERQGDFDRAESSLLEALSQIEQVQARLPAELRWRFLETSHETYASLYRLRMRHVALRPKDATAVASAFEIIERERSRDLAEAAHASRPQDPGKTADPEERLARIQIGLLSEIPESKRKALLRERTDAERDLMLRSGGGLLRRWTQVDVQPGDLRSIIGPEEALLTYTLDEPAAVFISTHSDLQVVRLPANSWLRDQAALFTDLHEEGKARQARASGIEVSRTVLAPVLAALDRSQRRLLIASTGELAGLPFGALPHPVDGQPLLQHFELSYTPSLRFIAALRRAKPPAGQGALVLADPSNGLAGASNHRGNQLGALPFALREGREVAAFFSTKKLLEGANATPEAVVLEGARYNALHFATHAVIDRRVPMNSALVLAPEDGSRTGWMTARQIYGLSLDATLVTLSSCRSSSGPRTRAASVPSLARAFLYAGSRAVVAGLWDADDAATRDLMSGFYGELARGRTVGEALRQAQRQMSRSQDAAHWACFAVIGDPQVRLQGVGRPPVSGMTWAAFALAGIGAVFAAARLLGTKSS